MVAEDLMFVNKNSYNWGKGLESNSLPQPHTPQKITLLLGLES